MIPSPDAGFVYPKTGLDVDLRFEDRPQFTSSGSMYLDGTDDFLNLDGLTWTSSGANYSFTCWIKSKTGSTDSKRVFGAKSSSVSDRINLYWDSGVTLKSYSEDGSTNTFTIGAVGLDDTWHHFALTVGSGTAVKFYLDGQLIATDTQPDMDFSSCDDFVVGAAYDGNTATSLDGNICHFGVWHDELSQAEIRELMTASTYAEAVSKGGSTPRAYYLLEADADDSVGTQNGTLTNGAVIVGDRARLPNGYDLSMTAGVPNQMSARCFSGRGIALDGTGDYIKLDGFNFDSTGAWTIESWMKLDTPSAARFWFAIGDANEVTCYYSTGAAGNIGFYPDGVADAYGSALPFCDGATWHHWCLSVGAGASATAVLYIDGKQYATSTVTVTDTSSEPKFRFAADCNGSNSLDGSITGIKVVVGTAYSAAQALEAYQVPEQPVPGGVTSSHLKCWLPCQDLDLSGAASLNGLFIQDASGNGNAGLMVNGAMEFSQSGIPQLGLRSSSSRVYLSGGASAEALSVAADSDINGLFNSGGTLSFWCFAFSSGGGGGGRLNDNASSGFRLAIEDVSGTTSDLAFYAAFDGTSRTFQTVARDFTFGVWQHVVITYDGSDVANRPVMYINNSAKTLTNPGDPVGTMLVDGHDKVFGNNAVTGGARCWDGVISEIAMWKTVLDADAVAVAYNSGVQGFDLSTDSGNYDVSSSLKAWFAVDNPVTCTDLTGNTAGLVVADGPNMATVPEGDTAGLSVFGTLTSKRPWNGLAGVVGYQAQYNVLWGNTASLPHIALGTNLWTISLWFKIRKSGTVDNGRIFDFYDGKGVVAHVQDADEFKIYLKGASGTPTAVQQSLTDAQMYDTWVHLVVRREAAATFSFVYHPLDQTAVTISDSTGTDAGSMTPDNDIPFALGGVAVSTNHLGTNSGAGFADVRIWDAESISDAQVNALYQSGARMLRGT